MTRRELLRLGACALALPLCSGPARSEPSDEELLDEVERGAFRFFWEQASPTTGQVKDRALASGQDTRRMSSIAATGFGLTGLCIADRRRYAPAADLRERVHATLRFLAREMPHEHGFFYHFVDMETADRWDRCELSSIDTALLLAGVLTCRQHYAGDREIGELATTVYERVDWPWMLNGGETLSMGWFPDKGFLAVRWDHYCELMMLYLLGLGSPTHPLSPATWKAWRRPKVRYSGYEYIAGAPTLFTHQYSHAWFDFRGRVDTGTDWFENSVRATRAHKAFCLELAGRFPGCYSEDLWGFSASDSARGYVSWGGPPEDGPIDGTIVPCAAGGSIPFLPAETLRVLRTIRLRHGEQAWGRYGPVDAFHPTNGWTNPDVLGIDLGITMLMAENHRSGFVWSTFMRDPWMREAMRRAGFQRA